MSNNIIELDENAREVIVHELHVKDESVFDLVQSTAESQRADQVALALKLGLLALNRITTTGETEIVKLEFSKLKDAAENIMGQLNQRVGCIFDTENEESDISKFIKELTDLIDPENKNSKLASFLETLSNMENEDNPFSKFLNLNNENSPLSTLKKDIVEKLQALDTKITTTFARRAERELGPGKGEFFEDDVEAFLTSRKNPGDAVVRTSTKGEGKGKEKKGDLRIELDRTEFQEDAIITIEAKDALPEGKQTLNGVGGYIQYLDNAIKQRKANFGILVMKYRDCLNEKSKSQMDFFLRENNKIFCTFDYDGVFLDLAYQMARLILSFDKKKALEGGEKMEIPVENINAEITIIIGMLKRFGIIKKSLGTIEKTTSDIKGDLDALKLDIETKVCDIRSMLGK